MTKSWFVIFLPLILLGRLVWAQSVETESSGNYQELMLAVNGKAGTMTGYYNNATGWDSESQRPRFTCIFYLNGKKVGDQYKIQTWFPGDRDQKVITGILRFLPREKETFSTLWIRLDQEHGGCWNVNPDLAKAEGTQLSMQGEATPWIEVRVVKAAKAHFFQKPGTAPTKIYVVEGDGLGVLEKKPGWVRADYQGKTKGWVREDDLFPTQVPRR